MRILGVNTKTLITSLQIRGGGLQSGNTLVKIKGTCVVYKIVNVSFMFAALIFRLIPGSRNESIE